MKNSKKTQAAVEIKPKDVAIKLLQDLHAKLLQQGTQSIKTNPAKTNIITRAMDNDLARVNYTMNLLKVKM